MMVIPQQSATKCYYTDTASGPIRSEHKIKILKIFIMSNSSSSWKYYSKQTKSVTFSLTHAWDKFKNWLQIYGSRLISQTVKIVY